MLKTIGTLLLRLLERVRSKLERKFGRRQREQQLPEHLFTPFETEAVRLLDHELRPYLAAIVQCIQGIEHFVVELAALENERPLLAHRVQLALLTQLAHHLRSMTILAPFGYPLPTATLAASVFEIGFAIAYVKLDENRAETWASHDNPVAGFKPVAELVEAVVAEAPTDTPSGQATNLYRNYSQLCTARHGNPVLVKETSLQVQEDAVVIEVGSHTGQQAVRVLQFALEQALGVACMALTDIVNRGVIRSASLEERVQRTNEAYRELHAASIERWGKEDPFEGKWRQRRDPPRESTPKGAK